MTKKSSSPRKEVDLSKISDILSMKDQTRVKGIVLALLAACLWGVSGAFAQFLFEKRGINFEWLLTIRMLVSGVLLLLYTSRQGFFKIWSIWKTTKDAGALLFFGVFGMLAVQYTFFATIQHSNAATATILQFLGPVIIACYFAVRERRFPAAAEALSVLFAISGTFFLVTHGRIGELSISGWALFFGILSAVAFAVYSIQPLRLLRKYESAVVTGWGMLIGGISSGFIHTPWQITGDWDNAAILLTLFIVLLGSLVAFYAYLTAAKIIGPKATSLLGFAEPLSAAFLASVWLKVPFSIFDWLGTGLILMAIGFLAVPKART